MAVLPEFTGLSRPIVAVREEVSRLLERQAHGRSLPPILIQGETGTGKGLLARAIHLAGPRRDGPFVAINCAAIPDALLEAELFGFERGAFTDARQSKPGLVQTAHGGTLFLDEIGLLPGPLQGKLLTVLEDRTVRRLGCTRSDPVDIAILTATSEDLERAVCERRFTEALYHRLSVLTLRLPPLRERGVDILLLADHFLARAAADYKVPPRALTHEACAALLAYSWPGNVRELSNRMERVTLIAEPGLVTPQMLALPEAPPGDVREDSSSGGAGQLRARMGSLERASLIEALTAAGGNITRAAAHLGVPPTTLRYRMRKHRLVGGSSPGESAVHRPDLAAGSMSQLASDFAPATGSSGIAVPTGRPLGRPRETPTDRDSAFRRRTAMEAERRQLTVMACRVSGSSVRREPLDPEHLHEAVQDGRAAAAEVMRRFEGHVVEQRADRLLAYFGYPMAHDDAAQRTAHAGLGIVEKIQECNRRLERERGIRLAVRLGIDTGLVVVERAGTGDEAEVVALGDAPDVALRVSELAEPGTVVISPATHRLIAGHFRCHALAPLVPGVASAAGPVYRILRGTAGSRLEASQTTALTPLVGREQEVRLLLERWEQATEGRGQAVLLSGEAGIGKSRLIQVLLDRLVAAPPARLERRCSPYHQNSALYPVIDHLERLLQFRPDQSAAHKLGALETALESHGFCLEEAVPLFAQLLSLPLPDRYPPLAMTPQRQRQKTLEALLAWLLKEAERRPALSVWEDLQWVDPSTLELLDLLIAEAPTARLLILLTCRPEFAPPWPARAGLTHLPIGRLPQSQVEVMIERMAGGRRVPADVLRQLAARTDGVPLFVEELTKMVLESGLLAEGEGRYGLTRPLASLTIPSTLHDSLMARLDRLGTGKAVAQLGATLGREFTYELIRVVSAMDEAALQRELARLVEADLLHRRGVAPQTRYIFKHALIQDAAYQSLLKSTRRHYHRQVARALEERFPEVSQLHPELMAHHLTEADLPGEAVVYWLKAGERAIERSASAEAVAHLRRGLDMLETWPDSAERTGHELMLQLTLGAALLMVKSYTAPEVEQAYARARELGPRVGDSPQLFAALFGLCRFHVSRAEVKIAHELGQECVALAERLGDSALLLEAYLARGWSAFHLGHFAAAIRDLEPAISLAPSRPPVSQPSVNVAAPGVPSRCFAARALWFLGYPDRALERSQEALALARQSAQPFTLGYALHQGLTLHTYRREPQIVQQLAEEAIALAREQGFARWVGSGLIRRGWALAEQGSSAEGLQQLREGLAIWQAHLGLSQFLALLAEAYAQAGQVTAGLGTVDEALAVAQRSAERHYEAELYRLKGELLVQGDASGNVPESPRRSEAAECFRRALDIARHQGAKSLELRVALSLGRLDPHEGDRRGARRMLGEVYGWFREGFATRDLQEARAWLDDWAS